MRRVLCVWFPRLATECLSPSVRGGGRTAAVVTVLNGGTKVEAVSKVAEAAGVKPGMGWGDARARCPSLLASPPAREREVRAMKAAARFAERYGPWVVRGMDEILVDVAGTAHLFGGEPAMLEDCRHVFADRGWSIRAAVADGPRAARGLARFAETSLTVGSPEEVRKLPVEALRLDAGTTAKLRRVGLRHVGDLASRSRPAIAERFGERLVRRLERLLGEKAAGSEPLGACPPRPELRASWEDVEPLRAPPSVEAVCARLLERLCSRLRQGDLGARKMILVLEFDGPGAEPRRIEVRAGRGLRTAGRWLALFRERPEAFDPGSGVARLELAAVAVEPFDPAADSEPEELWERLAVRFGPRNVVRFRPASRQRPETAFEVESVLARKSHQLPAADANLSLPKVAAVAGRTPSSRFDGEARSEVSATPSAPFSPCDPLARKSPIFAPPLHLGALATKVGEISGLARTSRRIRAVAAEPEHRAAASVSDSEGADSDRLDSVSAPSSGPSDPRSIARECGPPLRGLSALGPETHEKLGSDGPVPDGPGWPAEGGGNPRPLRLLAFPEPVGVERVPDDPLQPPAVLRRKGGRPVRLRRARGPERIALEWWCDGKNEGGYDGSPAGRDYWRVETEEGVRLWIYRDLHPGAAARWFLHGFFP